MYLLRIPRNASWVVRKVLEAREQLRIRSHSHGTISQQMQSIQLGGKFSIHKMYISLLPNHPKVAWKYLTMHPRIHPRHRFILWLAIQQRLATVERLLKVGINVTPECAFCGLHMETFTHLFFECRITTNIWRRVLQWLGHNKQPMRWEDEVHWMSQIAKKKGGTAEITSCAFAMVIYKLWQARNNARFQRKTFQPELLIKDMVIHLHVRGRNNATWRRRPQEIFNYPH
ncbi:hypothetical protein R3W88_011856 [Solanum pinnatisectum]|uniref:Reverse transcriptase zinc-binding domain-containing protein n=1 Tax=Solanum pinnatisectum TaxID=50273 RepID=A0AAV9L7T9_9SOLN|nr:hypothetical protein R3W88_011856 [Solanum pinnatisectum]